MKTGTVNLDEILLQTLMRKGVELYHVAPVVRDLMRSFSMNPTMDCAELNERMHLLGWREVEVDYHTCELARAAFEMTD